MTNDQEQSPMAQRRARRVTSPVLEERRNFSSLKKIGVVGGIVVVVIFGILWQSTLSTKAPAEESKAEAIAVNTPPSTSATADSAVTPSDTSATDASSMPTTSNEAKGPRNLEQIWKERLTALDAKRTQAFEQRDESLLSEVNVPDSPALAFDQELLEALIGRGVKPVAYQTTIHSAKPISSDMNAALIEVVDSRDEYVVTTESMNRTIQRFEEKKNQRWRVSLRNNAGSWQIYSVVSI